MSDLIDRAELAEEMCKAICGEERNLCVSAPRNCHQRCMVPIYAAPTVQPEVRRGKWIEYETSSYNGIDDNGEVKWIPKKFFRCSICRKGTAVRSNFCPNCGADMREVEHETD